MKNPRNFQEKCKENGIFLLFLPKIARKLPYLGNNLPEFYYFCSMKETEEKLNLIRKNLEEIREDHKTYGRERILDAWQMNILMRNDDHTKRLNELEAKVDALNFVMYVAIAISGTALGFALCMIFT